MENKSKKSKSIIAITIVMVLLFVSIYSFFNNRASTVEAAIQFPVNKPIILTVKISNRGNVSIATGFNNYFQIASAPNGGGTITEKPATFLAPLSANLSETISVTNTFTSIGEYSVRACADTANAVTESNEVNNCGSWLNISIVNSSSLPTTGSTYCSNGADNPIACTTFEGVCLNKATNPPLCTNLSCTNGATNPPLCDSISENINKCLLIEQNPLTFTPEEKARLAVLLRRFYLISSTLKTTEDITTIYNEIEQQKNFISQIDELTKQCYAQVNMSTNPQWVRHGNPWYTPAGQTGGTFPYTNANTGYYPSASANDSFAERVLNIW